jgi:curved DNA-binding protein CbpA
MASEADWVDHYAALGVAFDVDEKALAKAHRKLALKLHPDKNPDDPSASDKFEAMQRSFEVLRNRETRAAFDKVFMARMRQKLRHEQMDSKRRAFKESLERRERAAAASAKRTRGARRSREATHASRWPDSESELERRKRELRRESQRLIELFSRDKQATRSARAPAGAVSLDSDGSRVDRLGARRRVSLQALEALEQEVFDRACGRTRAPESLNLHSG